jgi:dimethylargininase
LHDILDFNMMPRFHHAILRQPSAQLIRGITTANLGQPDYQTALRQHAAYAAALEACGLVVEVLPADEEFPDATFVEDVALCTPACAIVTNPGAPSRNGERNLIAPILKKYYDIIVDIQAPGTLDAGDVMMVGDHYYIGLSDRTNGDGAKQLIAILKQHNMTGQLVPLMHVLHLKTGVSYLEHNNLLVCGEFVNDPIFAKFNCIEVGRDEAYAANSLWVNDHVFVPASCPQTQDRIAQLGYQVISLEVTEFEKIDGGLSCLSLRF